ncbi:MAG: kelch repeat-containing protein [Candidatus Sumerlaeaceae bacterium]
MNRHLHQFLCIALVNLVSCAFAEDWTWLKGGYLPDAYGAYGTLGMPAASNFPGKRLTHVTWRDNSGNLWLFGGAGYGTTAFGSLNDLWKYDSTLSQWVWVTGSTAINQNGTYGILGSAAAANTPGARQSPAVWTDNAGNLWLFGGFGYAAAGSIGYLNDLWKYDVSTGMWTWVKGSNVTGQAGVYGTQNVGSASNVPGARSESVAWTDTTGTLWLQGGNLLGDLWKYEIGSNEWTWIKGTNVTNEAANYGTQGVAAATNAPGARRLAVGWSTTGTLWLFGGYTSPGGYNSDLWKFDLSSGNWTWMKGSNTSLANGIYGTQGVEAAANTPGARHHGVTWTDTSGRLWLLGGGFGPPSPLQSYNDLWRYSPQTGNWTWMKGLGGSFFTALNGPGTYGTQGSPGASNTPGARQWSSGWIDNSGNLICFGGIGVGTGAVGCLNDMWKYDTTTGNWTWLNGSYSVNTGEGISGLYGTQGVASSSNAPGARWDAVSWSDNSGNFWLYGGIGFAEAGELWWVISDVWKYDTATGNWTWMDGSTTPSEAAVYGTQGVADPANTPGANADGATWTDNSGNLWLLISGGNALWRYNPGSGNWTWMKGTSILNQQGTYGSQGVPDPANTPGTRRGAVSWTDNAGNLWLLGGAVYNGTSQADYRNDLWKYEIGSGNWTWIKGSSTGNPPGVYGTLGQAAAANTPGGRYYAVSWKDAAGDFWLFGGEGYAAASLGRLNDLWKYEVASNTWTWMKGSNGLNQFATYGSLGFPAATNKPGARMHGVAWTDPTGALLLFGGFGNTVSSAGELNDLWKYTPSTGNWTWINGSNLPNRYSVYGSAGVPAPSNVIGGREGGTGKRVGNAFYMFGGYGYGASINNEFLGDLWQVVPAPSQIDSWMLY